MGPPHKPANPPRIKGMMKSDVTNETGFSNVGAQRRATARKQSLCSVYSYKGTKLSQNTTKSRNCLDVEDRSTLPVGLRKTVRPLIESAKVDKKGNHQCEVAFIRQLLALNKKQELLLNKKLAELLRDEPDKLIKGRMLKNDNPEDYSSSTVSVCDLDVENSQIVVNTPSSTKESFGVKPRTRIEYDLNGRRIYQERHEDDNESEDTISDDVQENQIEMVSRNSQSWFNATTLIQAKSDMSCNLNNVGSMTAQRKSLTLVNQQSLCKLKPRERCLSLCSDRGTHNPRSCYTRGLQQTSKDAVFCRRTIHGDGIQNVIAHCCQVDMSHSGSKKTVQRVWNYHEIPKTQSDGSASESGRAADSHREVGSKVTTKLKSAIPPISSSQHFYSH